MEKAEIRSYLAPALNWSLTLALFLPPLIFVPFLADSFDLPKNTFIFIAGLLVFILFLAESAVNKTRPVIRSVFDLPVIVLAAAVIVSALLSVNPYLSLISDPLTFGGCALLFLIVGMTSTKKLWQQLLLSLLFSGVLVSLWSIVQTVLLYVPTVKIPLPFFNPAGSPLAAGLFLAILLPLGLGLAVKSKKLAPISAALAAGLLACLATVYKNNPALLDTATAWRIATGILGQSLKSALVGVSPAHFIDAFTAFRPVEFNNTLVWNSRFATSSNFYLYLLTAAGIAGLAAFLWLTVRFVLVAKKRLQNAATTPLEKGLLGSIAVAFILMLVLPAPVVSIFALFVLLGLLVSFYNLDEIRAFAYPQENFLFSQSVRVVLLVAAVIILLGSSFFLGRFILADYSFRQSLVAAAANKGTDTYNLQIRALTLNPWNDSYRVAYSQTNLALADSLASQPNLSDQQKQTVVTLVQQSIREARLAASLEPNRAANWENLSFIYRNLLNFAQGASDWAVATQNQAITLDPLQPRLRLDLGGIYYGLGDYQTAAQIFAQAVNLKPDFANAHYNLAQALKNLKLKDQALAQLQLTGALICGANQNSADCARVNAEIAELGSTPASPAAVVAPGKETESLASPSSASNLEKAKTKPPVKISSPSGEITP